MKKQNKKNEYSFFWKSDVWASGAVVFAYNKKRLLNFLVVVLMLGMNSLGLSAIGETVCFYNDIEDSNSNLFVAGSLDFLLNDFGFDPIEPALSIGPGDTTSKDIEVTPELESNPFQYAVQAENFEGDQDFCNALNVKAELLGNSMYEGDLTSLLTGTSTVSDIWNFEFGIGTNNFQNKVCNFDIVYNGWQTRHNYESYENGGFSDTEKTENTIASWGLRINKVYYDVASDRGEESSNEWVEIYNQTNTAIDINGWQICDNHECDILSAMESIPAQGYGFIVASKTTASTTMPAFWYLPVGVVEVNIPDSKIGNGLSNDGDVLYLKRADGVVIDQMNWQSNTDVWDPGAVDVAEGNVLARQPNGYDTDQASDWVELIPPSVDLIYPDEAGSYTWYWGTEYDIKWTAINNNGNDSDLDMSIFYVKDIDHNGEVSESDVMMTIANTTENDGLYRWQVPCGFTGYIWIYLVATGPENPMLNVATISGDIYDPIPLFIGAEEGDDDVDVEAPVITINGNNPAYLELNFSYSDLGAMVDDNVNKNLGVHTEGGVDTTMLGEYEIIYTATDGAGNIATAVRRVIVYDPIFGIPVVENVVEETLVEEIVVSSGGGSVEVVEEVESEVIDIEEVVDTIIEETPTGEIEETSLDEVTEEDEVIVENELIEEVVASSTPEMLPILEEESENASSTPELLIEEDVASSTPEILIEEDVASSTPEILSEEGILAEENEEIIEEEVIVEEVEETVVIENEVIEEELVVNKEEELEVSEEMIEEEVENESEVLEIPIVPDEE